MKTPLLNTHIAGCVIPDLAHLDCEPRDAEKEHALHAAYSVVCNAESDQ